MYLKGGFGMSYNYKITAYANIIGGNLAPNIYGNIFFDDVEGGTEVYLEVWGLPLYQPAKDGLDPIGPFGFHIHEIGVCEIADPENLSNLQVDIITQPISLMAITLAIFLLFFPIMAMLG